MVIDSCLILVFCVFAGTTRGNQQLLSETLTSLKDLLSIKTTKGLYSPTETSEISLDSSDILLALGYLFIDFVVCFKGNYRYQLFIVVNGV